MLKKLRERFRSPDSFVSLILGLAVVLVVGTLVYNYATRRGPQLTKEEEQKQAQEQQVSLPATHTVAAGETLWSVSEKYYKSGYNWVSIRDANTMVNPDYIEVGQTLTIPNVAPIAPSGEISATAVEQKPANYTVVKGDDLWHVAERFYGTGYKWGDIASANSLVDPNLIHAGNVLTLP